MDTEDGDDDGVVVDDVGERVLEVDGLDRDDAISAADDGDGGTDDL